MTNIVEMIHNIDLQLQIMQIDIYNLDVKIDNNWHMIKGSTSLMRERKEGGSLWTTNTCSESTTPKQKNTYSQLTTNKESKHSETKKNTHSLTSKGQHSHQISQ